MPPPASPMPRDAAALPAQFLRFVAVGTATTAVQYAVLWVGVSHLAWPAAIASAAGYALGVLAGYFCNHRFTFRSDRPHASALRRYVVVFGLGWCLNALLMGLLVHRWQWPVWPAQLLTTTVGLLWNFSGSRWWTFRARGR